MATVGEVVIRFTGDDRQAQLAMRRVEQGLGRMKSALVPTQSAFGGVIQTITSFRTALVSVLGAGGLALLVQRSLASADAIAKMSTRLGIGVEALQELQHAARLSGVDMKQFELGMVTFGRRIAEGAAGMATGARLFDQLGFSATDAQGRIRNITDVFGDFAEQIASTSSQAQRLRLASEAFGVTAGSQLLPMLERGRAGLEEMFAEARRLGLVLEESAIRQLERTKDAFERVSSVISSNLMRALVAIGPHLEELTNKLATFTSRLAIVLDRFAPDATAPLEELAARIVDLRREIEMLEKARPKGVAGFIDDPLGIKGRNIDEEIARRVKRIAELRKLLGQRQRREAMRGLDLIISPEQLQAVDAFQKKLLDLAVTDTSAKAMLAVRMEAEKLKNEAPALAERIDVIAAAMEALIVRAAELKRAWDPDELKAMALDDFLRTLGGSELTEWEGMGQAITDVGSARAKERQERDEAAHAKWVDSLGDESVEWEGLGQAMKDIAADRRHVGVELEKLRKVFELIDKQALVLGDSFQASDSKITALRATLTTLLEQGLAPTSAEIQNLKAQLDALENIERVKDIVSETLGSFRSAVTTSVRGVIQGTQTIQQAFANMGQSIVLSLTETVINRGLKRLEKALLDFIDLVAQVGLGQALGIRTAPAAAVAGPTSSSVAHSVAISGPLQHGGIVRRPTMALIGEAGPEAVVPLHRLGGGVNLHVEIVNNAAGLVGISRGPSRRGPDGREIQRFIVDTVRSGIGAGMFDGPLGQRFGSSPRVEGR